MDGIKEQLVEKINEEIKYVRENVMPMSPETRGGWLERVTGRVEGMVAALELMTGEKYEFSINGLVKKG